MVSRINLVGRQLRKLRVRAKISGTAIRPRISVFRSAKHISAQLIDDTVGKTLVAAHDGEVKGEKQVKVAVAFAVGKLLAEKAKKAGVETAVFDRNGFVYTGRVSALADGAREGGLTF
jgi:large subunit ribosomal protein L18